MNSLYTTDINKLLSHFSKNTYFANQADETAAEALEKCIALMSMDYTLIKIPNSKGELSASYPSQIVIPEHQISHGGASGSRTIYETTLDRQLLKDLMQKARHARCRTRFPVPVILYKNKFICRSATLSGGYEIYGRIGVETAQEYFSGTTTNGEQDLEEKVDDSNFMDLNMWNKVRADDIKLLKTLNVGVIIDLMVEKKKTKFNVQLSSSEKADKKQRYMEFPLFLLPYPGCEFFKNYRDNNYSGENLVFDWTQPHIDIELDLPDEQPISQLSIDWSEYKEWDLITLTQNYLKVLLKYLQEGNSGILIHCISGWDRTPLFISLLRISLWADGLAHQGLDVVQMLYLTIAYDWMLFGHHLSDRISKGEEIFFFCFHVLKFLEGEEFSLSGSSRHKIHKSVQKSDITERNASRTEIELRSVSRAESDRGSESVSRTADIESLLDPMLLDQDSRDSNISQHSSSSSMSNKSHELPSIVQPMQEEFSNGNSYLNDNSPLTYSPQSQHNTSPVSVPFASRLRQRHESSSSLSGGSWQMITGTGSLRGSDSNSVASFNSSSTNGNRDEFSASQDSTQTVTDEDIILPQYSRKERLQKMRQLFFNCYGTAVGLRFKDGSDTPFGSMLASIREKVGLGPRL